jgi:hypothetical protein
MGEASRRRKLGLAPREKSTRPLAPYIVTDGHGREHDLTKADPSCKWCLGTGIQATVVSVDGKKRQCTICRCVTNAERAIEEAKKAQATP